MSNEDRIPVTFRLPAVVKERIERLAEKERRSMNEQMVYLLEQALLISDAQKSTASNGKAAKVAA